eukprot:2762552-Prymnesium_polylepis.1
MFVVQKRSSMTSDAHGPCDTAHGGEGRRRSRASTPDTLSQLVVYYRVGNIKRCTIRFPTCKRHRHGFTSAGLAAASAFPCVAA